MRGYYQTSERWGKEALEKRRLKLSRLEDMNDPFELLGVRLKKKKDRTEFQRLKKELNEEIGVLCFSKTWHNPVMWSHYGDRHRGLCLGFDLLNEWTFPISYEAERLLEEAVDVDAGDFEGLGHKLLLTKYEHWMYEEEVRMIVRLEDAVSESGLFFLPFCNGLRLKDAIIGARNKSMPTDIAQHIAPDESVVLVRKARLAFNSFKIVQDRSVKVIEAGSA